MNVDLGGSGKGFNLDMLIEQKINEKVSTLELSPIKQQQPEHPVEDVSPTGLTNYFERPFTRSSE